jgi:hypothetical protein
MSEHQIITVGSATRLTEAEDMRAERKKRIQ